MFCCTCVIIFMLNKYYRCDWRCRTEFIAASTRTPNVLALSDPRTRDRVPAEPLPHPQASHRDRTRALSNRAPGQDLVPEPPHEGQKGKGADHGTQRAGKNVVVVVVMATAAASAAGRGYAWTSKGLHGYRGCRRQRTRSLKRYSDFIQGACPKKKAAIPNNQ